MKSRTRNIACSALIETIWTLGVAVASGMALLSWPNGQEGLLGRRPSGARHAPSYVARARPYPQRSS